MKENIQNCPTSISKLNEQVQSFNLELQDANHNLLNKVAELDIITDYLKNILENIAQGILFIDLNGMVTTCNKAAEEILGISGSSILHKRFWDSFKDDAFGFSMYSMLKGKQRAGVFCANYTSPLGRHSELEITLTFSPKNGVSKSNQGIIVMVRDLSEIHRLQVIAARADRMKVLGEMAAQVAHEIRNPLGGIKGFASLLKRDLAWNPELQKMTDNIIEGTDSLNNLVDQILHYSRPVQPHLEYTDLIKLLHQVKDHVLADANIYRPDILILIHSPAEEIVLSLDSAHFKSAILNLIVNAIQAMPKGGTISLSVEKHPKWIILKVADTGMGIAAEILPKLYSPFFTTKPKGNGLGLVEVQKIIQAHGGTIDVATALNEGTTFTIKLPLQEPIAKMLSQEKRCP